MNRKPIPPRIVVALLAAGVILPIAISVILAVSAFVSGMGDSVGGKVLQSVALGCGILWAIDLVCLVLALGLNWLSDASGPPS